MSINLKENAVVEVLNYFGFIVNEDKVSFKGKELSSERLDKTEKVILLLGNKIHFLYLHGNGECKNKTVDLFNMFKCIKEDTGAKNSDILNLLYYVRVGIETADIKIFEEQIHNLLKAIYVKPKRTYKYYDLIWSFYILRSKYVGFNKEKQFTLDFFN